MSTNTFFIQSGSIFFISGTLEPSQSVSESIVVDGDNAGTTESIVLSSTFKPEESAVGLLSLDSDFTSFFISGSTASSSLYFSGSGEIGFGTKDPKNEFDIKADTFKIRSRDGKKETEFRDGRFISKKFKGGIGTETTGSQLVLSYTPGTFENPTTASAGDILGTVTWEDLSISNRRDATAMQIQGKVDAVAVDGSSIKGTMRFGIGSAVAGNPINEVLVLAEGSVFATGSNLTVSDGFIQVGNTTSDADRRIIFQNDTSAKDFIIGVDENQNCFAIHSSNGFITNNDFEVASNGNVTITNNLTVSGDINGVVNGGSF